MAWQECDTLANHWALWARRLVQSTNLQRPVWLPHANILHHAGWTRTCCPLPMLIVMTPAHGTQVCPRISTSTPSEASRPGAPDAGRRLERVCLPERPCCWCCCCKGRTSPGRTRTVSCPTRTDKLSPGRTSTTCTNAWQAPSGHLCTQARHTSP